MGRRLAVVVNPTAGRGRAIVVGREVREQLEAAGHLIMDVSGASAIEADGKLRTAIARSNVDAVIAVGGDGLVNLAASTVVDTGIPLALIPAGTGDDIARGLGISRHSHRDIAALVAALAHAKIPTRPVDVGQVWAGENGNGVTGSTHRYFLSVLTAGLDAAVNARANGMRFPRGKARYLFALVAELRRYRAYDYELIIDGAASSRSLILACVANMAYFGGGMKIAPTAHPESGQLHAVLVDRVSLPKLLWIFPRIFWGGHVRHPAVHVLPATEIELRHGQGVEPPAPFADGEPVSQPPLRCTVKPGALHIVQLG